MSADTVMTSQLKVHLIFPERIIHQDDLKQSVWKRGPGSLQD